MKTSQTTRGWCSAIAKIIVLANVFVAGGGGADRTIYYEITGFTTSDAQFPYAKPALKLSKFCKPEILTPKVPGRTLCACIQGWSRQA
jgi:hypothetical protein